MIYSCTEMSGIAGLVDGFLILQVHALHPYPMEADIEGGGALSCQIPKAQKHASVKDYIGAGIVFDGRIRMGDDTFLKPDKWPAITEIRADIAKVSGKSSGNTLRILAMLLLIKSASKKLITFFI